MKKKISVTIDTNLLHWIDEEIKTFRFRNRSHAFEYALAQLKEAEKKQG